MHTQVEPRAQAFEDNLKRKETETIDFPHVTLGTLAKPPTQNNTWKYH